MNAGIITMTIDDLAKKLGLPEGIEVVGCEISITHHKTVLFSLRGPGLPKVVGRPGEVLQVVSMVTETRFE